MSRGTWPFKTVLPASVAGVEIRARGNHRVAQNDEAEVGAPECWPQPSLEPIRSFASIEAEANEEVRAILSQPLGTGR